MRNDCHAHSGTEICASVIAHTGTMVIATSSRKEQYQTIIASVIATHPPPPIHPNMAGTTPCLFCNMVMQLTSGPLSRHKRSREFWDPLCIPQHIRTLRCREPQKRIRSLQKPRLIQNSNHFSPYTLVHPELPKPQTLKFELSPSAAHGIP